MIITIDGPAGTGKSTVAKQVAERLGFVFFDTGAMYRAVAFLVLKDKVSLEPSEIISLLNRFSFRITEENGEKKYWVNELEVTEEIRKAEVTSYVSKVAALPIVRRELVQIQRRFAQSGNSVFEGRDMGSAVFPKADLKIYLDASAEIRAKRRFLELKSKSDNLMTQQEVLEDLKRRDTLDSTRECCPLVQPEDAFVIDTSNLTVEEVVSKIIFEAKRKVF